eukprot:gnl/TRDRNA2_/TRDRNA2_204042_c0_seq1.p1 gnl/TRDRNA2_/TRDRNA2_204042_c0~~gnl/TRDRNA2_/TRDRNA2_204042_c0_seq1.p1  ORF type:complete len:193 (-),score=38.78 gnl/TRDRNA2_/TRDRNA2_204042_c0_seq1:60-638(-)
MGVTAGTANTVELKTADEVGRPRLARLYPWKDLVDRTVQALALRDPVFDDLDLTHSEILELLERAEPRIHGLGESAEEFLNQCPPCEGAGAAMVPVDWVKALLQELPALRDTRFKLVPRQLKEEVFWDRYFGAVFAIITEELSEVGRRGIAAGAISADAGTIGAARDSADDRQDREKAAGANAAVSQDEALL